MGHIIDPRSGQPVEHTLLTAVVHRSAMVSDALSTALLVLGGDGIGRLEARFPGAEFLMVDADGTVRASGDSFILTRT